MIPDDSNPNALAALAIPWLAQQCRMIQGVECGLLAAWDETTQAFHTLARWPADAPEGTGLSSVVRTAWQRSRGVALDGADHRHGLIACPLQLEDRKLGVVAIRVGPGQTDRLPVILQALQWATAWLALSLRHAGTGDGMGASFTLDLLHECLGADSFAASAACAADRLARQLGCARVSLGWRRRDAIRLLAISHLHRFDPRSAAAQTLAETMTAALAADAPPLQPAPPTIAPSHSAFRLSLRQGGETRGVLLLEYAAGCSPDPALLEPLPERLAPLTALLALREREAQGRMLQRLRRLPRLLFGPRHPRLKAAALAAVLGLGIALVPGPYRVSAPAELEGRTQRAVVAPQDGYIATATVRPGDRVRSGELVATLEARELRLQQANWQAELDRHRKAYRNALAERDWAQSRIAGAQLAQAQAQLGLVETQLERSQLHAPLDGVVVAGDLPQSLGAPVQRGQILLEIAPLDGYRVILKVDERRIAGIRPGQTGQLVLAGAPASSLPVRIESVTPVATVEDGHNRFRVEAQLLETPDWLRPGMSGLARIVTGERPYGWIWTHDLVDWLRLSLWKLLP